MNFPHCHLFGFYLSTCQYFFNECLKSTLTSFPPQQLVAAKPQASRARLELLEATRQLATSAAAAKAVEFELVRLSEQSRVMTPHTATWLIFFFFGKRRGW